MALALDALLASSKISSRLSCLRLLLAVFFFFVVLLLIIGSRTSDLRFCPPSRVLLVELENSQVFQLLRTLIVVLYQPVCEELFCRTIGLSDLNLPLGVVAVPVLRKLQVDEEALWLLPHARVLEHVVCHLCEADDAHVHVFLDFAQLLCVAVQQVLVLHLQLSSRFCLQRVLRHVTRVEIAGHEQHV